MVPDEPVEPTFDFEGSLPLDFANTVSGRTGAQRRDRLRDYRDLVAWGRQGGLLTDGEAGELLARAERRPEQAATVFARAIALREAIYRILAASARPPADDSDLATLNRELAHALGHLRVLPGANGFAWGWEDGAALDRVLWPVARAAAELLASDELARVRACAADWCGWLFVDRSRAGRRQWCDMRTCGNRAKARRHYARTRARSAQRDATAPAASGRRDSAGSANESADATTSSAIARRIGRS